MAWGVLRGEATSEVVAKVAGEGEESAQDAAAGPCAASDFPPRSGSRRDTTWGGSGRIVLNETGCGKAVKCAIRQCRQNGYVQ